MRQAEITVVGMLKGGTGKTTSAIYLGCLLAAEGAQVGVVDADSVSQSAHEWMRYAIKNGHDFPVTVERYPFDDLGSHLDELRSEYDHLVVDVGGGNTALLIEALRRADRLIIPLSPSEMDTHRVVPTIKAAKAAAVDHTGDGLAVHVLLTKCDHTTRQPRDARAQLTEGEFSYPVLDSMISQRVGYQRAYGTVPGDLSEYRMVMDEIREAV